MTVESRTSPEEISLLDCVVILAKYKLLVFVIPLVAALLAVAISFLFPNIYVGTSRILPPQQGLSSALSALSSLGSASPISIGALGIKNPSDLYVGLLKSRTVADRIISKFDLQQIYDEETLTDTRRTLENATTISANKDSIIVIEVEDESPPRASAIANAYVIELEQLLKGLAVTEASQRRLFFEHELTKAREALTSAEVALEATQQATGLIKLDEQGRAIIEYIASVRAKIAAKEIQLTSMSTFATPLHPDYLRGREELRKLRQQLVELENQSQSGKGDIFVPTGTLPTAAAQYLRKYRDLKYQEAVFEVLSKQYEQARIEEANSAAIVQTIDVAVVPDKRAKPRRAAIGLFVFLASSLLMAIGVFVFEGMNRADTTKKNQTFAALKRYFSTWR